MTNPLTVGEALKYANDVIATQDLIKWSIGLRRIDPPDTSLLPDLFLTSNVLDPVVGAKVIQKVFWLVNEQQPGSNVYTVCNPVNKTKLYSVAFPSEVVGLAPGLFLVIDRAGGYRVVSGVRNFSRLWATMAFNTY